MRIRTGMSVHTKGSRGLLACNCFCLFVSLRRTIEAAYVQRSPCCCCCDSARVVCSRIVSCSIKFPGSCIGIGFAARVGFSIDVGVGVVGLL